MWLYRARLGWLLGDRFLLLVHRGRRSGRRYQTVLEVVRFDRAASEWTVVAGYGPTSDWYRNVLAGGAEHVETNCRRFTPTVHVLDEEERRDLLVDYQRRHPRAARQLGDRLLGVTWDGSAASVRELAARLPAVAFRPVRSP